MWSVLDHDEDMEPMHVGGERGQRRASTVQQAREEVLAALQYTQQAFTLRWKVGVNVKNLSLSQKKSRSLWSKTCGSQKPQEDTVA